ncbi:major facilitator superfamily domain-containing protein [Truncatella angustata]|uniref:Major facilitator superfamily domain-containing protein n=1 Tax=Truncatella angustata TaxID=152316 RepID=A0A9P8UDZ2_9PEZI|nr:major facilitator superfamily domain-containing protein [Truncatella angustata]KAH6648175.1 major facilitator superfamily domain-containing protein [Truncatella angustata]
MWSIKQYRQIGKDVNKEFSRGSEQAKTPSATQHSAKSQDSVQNDQARSTDAESSDPKPCGGKNDKAWVDTVGDEDPLDPRNWPLSARIKNVAILCLLIFVQGWAGAAESIANTAITQQFGVSKVAANLTTAMYTFGIGSGSMFAGPLSETVGRNPVYLISTFCYLFFVLGCALTPTFGGLVVCRYFVGLFSSATLSINGSSVRDQFRPVKRAFVFPVIAWANIASPVIAPIAGGWIVQNPSLGWRWTEWVTLIISAFGFLVALFFLPETYLPVLLDWKARHLRRVTGDDRYASKHAENSAFFRKMKEVLPMPAKFLFLEPVISVLGGYLILLYVLLFSFLSGFDYVFKQPYNETSGIEGSHFAAVAAGATVFTLGAPGLYSSARSKTEHVHRAKIAPEFRLWPAIIAGPLLPVALFWLGWTNYSTISEWSGIGACFLFGMVLTAIYVSSYEYIVDSYGDHSAIALASITMARYFIAGGMILATRPMYEGIGVHWTMTWLGCVAVILAPAPLLFWKLGPKIRKKSPYATDQSV